MGHANQDRNEHNDSKYAMRHSFFVTYLVPPRQVFHDKKNKRHARGAVMRSGRDHAVLVLSMLYQSGQTGH